MRCMCDLHIFRCCVWHCPIYHRIIVTDRERRIAQCVGAIYYVPLGSLGGGGGGGGIGQQLS